MDTAPESRHVGPGSERWRKDPETMPQQTYTSHYHHRPAMFGKEAELQMGKENTQYLVVKTILGGRRVIWVVYTALVAVVKAADGRQVAYTGRYGAGVARVVILLERVENNVDFFFCQHLRAPQKINIFLIL